VDLVSPESVVIISKSNLLGRIFTFNCPSDSTISLSPLFSFVGGGFEVTEVELLITDVGKETVRRIFPVINLVKVK
jgi:hypothetical protein